MPSIEESKKQVKAGLKHQHEPDHDAILANLQDEIDRYNEERDEATDSRRRSAHRHRHDEADEQSHSSLKFRFKSSSLESRKRKRHRSRDDARPRHRKCDKEKSETPSGAAHPFPREPVHIDRESEVDPNAAFRESLFDALADDEGAAYWESVYSQPIHVYARPTVETANGELEQMNDEDYAAYVATRMWEKKNPHIVLERERKEKERKADEEERTQRRDDFIRRKERAAWERAQKEGSRRFAGLGEDENGYEYVFDDGDNAKRTPTNSRHGNAREDNGHTWTQYLAAWDRFKVELLNARDSTSSSSDPLSAPSKRIPFPVLDSKPVTRANIEEFMRNVPREQNGQTKLQLLKHERVKFHPDKMQHRFGGVLDAATMKVVTEVFQVVDAIFEKERARG